MSSDPPDDHDADGTDGHDSTGDGDSLDDSDGAATDEAAGDDGDPAPEQPASSSRRWLIRILVGLGLGIPIAIEGATFVGLIRSRLLDGDEDGGDGDGNGDGDGDTPTATPTPTRTPVPTIPPEGVGVGDELLPATRQVDRVQSAELIPRDDGRTFSFTVEIDNTGEESYEVTLGRVTTEAGERITGSNPASGEIEPGTEGAVTGTWDLPPGATPASIQVVAVTFPSGETVVEEVPLAPVPVRDEE